jgi:hypothetical protein
MSIYYVYAYLRSKDSPTAIAGTPYYIGKGKGRPVIINDAQFPSIQAAANYYQTSVYRIKQRIQNG